MTLSQWAHSSLARQSVTLLPCFLLQNRMDPKLVLVELLPRLLPDQTRQKAGPGSVEELSLRVLSSRRRVLGSFWSFCYKRFRLLQGTKVL